MSLIDSPKKILIVEDDADSNRILLRLLRMNGFFVEAAGGHTEALKLARQRNYDLLLSDIQLPDGNGLALLRHIRDIYPLKSIAITGTTLAGADICEKLDEFDRCFTKPVDWRKIEKAIAELLPPVPTGS